jgi:hypothetical protein
MYVLSEKQSQILARHLIDDISTYCANPANAIAYLQFKASLEGSEAYASDVASGGGEQPYDGIATMYKNNGKKGENEQSFKRKYTRSS